MYVVSAIRVPFIVCCSEYEPGNQPCLEVGDYSNRTEIAFHSPVDPENRSRTKPITTVATKTKTRNPMNSMAKAPSSHSAGRRGCAGNDASAWRG